MYDSILSFLYFQLFWLWLGYHVNSFEGTIVYHTLFLMIGHYCPYCSKLTLKILFFPFFFCHFLNFKTNVSLFSSK